MLHRMWVDGSEFRWSRQPHDQTSCSSRLTRVEPRRSCGDDGRGDLVESPEPKGSDALKVVGQIETPRPPDPILRPPRADREEKRVTHGSGQRREEPLDFNNPNQRRLLVEALPGGANNNDVQQSKNSLKAFFC